MALVLALCRTHFRLPGRIDHDQLVTELLQRPERPASGTAVELPGHRLAAGVERMRGALAHERAFAMGRPAKSRPSAASAAAIAAQGSGRFTAFALSRTVAA